LEIGVSTACFYPALTEETLPVIARLGVRLVEVFLNAPSEADETFCQALKFRADQLGLEIRSVHTFSGAYEYVNLFSQYPRRRECALMEYRHMARAARILGARYITFHGDRKNQPQPASMEMYCDSVKRVMDLCREQGVELTQENVSWCRSSELEFLRELDRQLGPCGLRYTLDVKQARRAGHSWEEYADIMGKRLANLHLSDARQGVSCLVPGMGTVDFTRLAKWLHQIQYQGDALVEVYRDNFTTEEQFVQGVEFLRINMQ
jgi:sugar phosphate isomerase/epimerase